MRAWCDSAFLYVAATQERQLLQVSLQMHIVVLPALAVLFIGVIKLVTTLVQRATSPLSSVPGPWHTRWTSAASRYHWIRGELPAWTQELHEKYGDVVRVNPRAVDFCSVAAAKKIHSFNRPFLKSTMYKSFGSVKGIPDVFSVRDPIIHARHRKLLSAPISDSGLKSFEHVVHARANLAVEQIGKEMEMNGTADVLKWWMFFSTDVIGELTFGDSFRMLEKGKVNAYAKDLQDIAGHLGARLTFPTVLRLASYIPIPKFSAAFEANVRMRTYAETSIIRYENIVAAQPDIHQPSLFSKLFNTKEETMPRAEIVSNAQSYITAGSDTTAHTLSYLTWAVSKNEAVKAKLVAELQTLPEGYSDEDLKKLKYLNQVIYETLRCYAAAPALLPRVVPAGGCEIDGYLMPGGTDVQTQAYSMHRNPEVFPDPERYDPERWESPTKDMNDAWMPFGGGARVCLGIHLARMELRVATAKFFTTFPNAKVPSGFNDAEMEQVIVFLMYPKGKRTMIQSS
ncbi:cytochrome P450 [Boeremia exigua]|uniref:cytochrome P450 n=1 Tax=Boeremia exigua TaxID=749465 RepID=UPI001E8CC4C1|nr:cytochrome P450 [Boeremia exigua]KAH6620203.1 cytochrome P450 [Boeremia exigua]